MKKSLLGAILATSLVATLGLVACGGQSAPASSNEPEATPAEEQPTEPAATPATDGAAYGYTGEDPVEAAVYKYMAEEMSKNYEPADASIPTVQIVKIDATNPDDVIVYGDFWVENYKIDGETLSCTSGGNYPGVMHVTKNGDTYTVSSFDQVADGSNFDSSAKELFGDNYDAFMKVYSDSDARTALRITTVSNYVKANGLAVTQYQDYGWDPVQLNK